VKTTATYTSGISLLPPASACTKANHKYRLYTSELFSAQTRSVTQHRVALMTFRAENRRILLLNDSLDLLW
jgi:hypothetical protein